MGDVKQVIAKNIRIFRGKRTLQEVATEAGLSVGFLSDIENGRRSCSTETIEKLAKTFCVEPHELLQNPIKSRQDGETTGLRSNKAKTDAS